MIKLSTSPCGTGSKERLYFFDNFKAILIVLVVFGHFLLKFSNPTGYVNILISMIYSFHMPAFVFISGYFSKNLDKNRHETLSKNLVLYVVFAVVYSLVYRQTLIGSLIDPVGIMWFLLCIIIWKIILEQAVQIKYIIPLSVIIAILIGFNDDIGKFLSLSRLLCFFPFFLLGYKCSKDLLLKIRAINHISCAILLVFSFAVIFISFYFGLVNLSIPYFSSSYVNIGYKNIFLGASSRLFIILVACIIILCLINLTPNKNLQFTYVGKNTLYIYLLHTFLVDITFYLISFINVNIYVEVFIMLWLSIILSVVLGLDIISNFLSKVFDIISRFLIKEG